MDYNRQSPELRNPRESWQSYIMNAPMRSRNALMNHAIETPLSNIPHNLLFGTLNKGPEIVGASERMMSSPINAPIDGTIVEDSMTMAVPLGPSSGLGMMAGGSGAMASASPFNQLHNLFKRVGNKIVESKQKAALRSEERKLLESKGQGALDAKRMRERMETPEFADEMARREAANQLPKAIAPPSQKPRLGKETNAKMAETIADFVEAGGSIDGTPKQVYHRLVGEAGVSSKYTQQQVMTVVGKIRNSLSNRVGKLSDVPDADIIRHNAANRNYSVSIPPGQTGDHEVKPDGDASAGDAKDTPKPDIEDQWLAGP